MNHVLILAGGKGERLRPLTQDRPKAMVEVMGRPLLDYQVKWLTYYGFKEITICCGYQHRLIVDFFGDGKKHGASIHYSIEDQPLGRGGALKKGMQSIGRVRKPVLALNGDIITEIPLDDLMKFHKEQDSIATLVSVPLVSPYGIVDINGKNEVEGFREKPELPFWINAGIYVLEPSILDRLPDVGDHEVDTFPQLARQGELSAYKSKALWRAVDTIKDLTELERELTKAPYQMLRA